MNWWEMDPKEVVSRLYWFRGQLPPKDYDWEKIKAELEKKYPIRKQA